MAKFVVEIDSASAAGVNTLLECLAVVTMRLVEKGAMVGEFDLAGHGLYEGDITFSISARN